MKLPLPPDVEFHEDICLLIHRPRGMLNKAAINKIVSIIGELEFTLKKPFNRFLDTVAADAVDLNLEYIRRVSLYRRGFYGNRPAIKTAILATDSALANYGRLHASLTQGSRIPGSQRSRAMARCPAGNAGGERPFMMVNSQVI